MLTVFIQARIAQLVAYRLGTGEVPGSNCFSYLFVYNSMTVLSHKSKSLLKRIKSFIH